MQKKKLEQKDMVNFKIHDVTAWSTNNSIHVLPNISRNKDNQTIKVGKLTREIFFFESYAKNEEGKLVPDLFLFLNILNMINMVCSLVSIFFDSL